MSCLRNRPTGLLISAFLIFLFATGSPLCPWIQPAQAFSVGEEREVGEKLLTLIRQSELLLDDPDIVQYINRLGRQILKTSGSPEYFDYQFFVISNKEFNAFAAPSGLIFIHSGLIEVTESEDELVSVIAHEIGHVASRHIAEQIEKSSKISIGTAAMILAGIAMGGGPLAGALITGSLAANASAGLYYSRQNEEEADRLAFNSMQAMNRDPVSMISMFEKMRKISQYKMGAVPPYLLSHPEPAARQGYIQDLLISKKTTNYPITDQFAFNRIKRRILAYSKDPASLIPRYLKVTTTEGADQTTKAMAYYGLFQVYSSTADCPRARQALSETMTVFQDRPLLLADLGNLLFQEGKFEEAQKTFERAKAADPDNSYITFNLARVLEQQGDAKAALALYEELLPVQPTSPRLHYQIGQIMDAQGNKPQSYYHLGLFFWYKGDPGNAKFHLKQTIKALPAGDPIRIQAEVILATINRIEKV